MRWRQFLFALLVPCAALSAGPAKAADHVEFALDFGGAPGCPSEQAFQEAVQARLPEARRMPESPSVPLLRVRLNVEPGQPRLLWLLLPDGTGVQRQVSDAACTDAVQSMAVISAIALEANQRRAAELDGASVATPRAAASAQSEPTGTTAPMPAAASASASTVAVQAVPSSADVEHALRASRPAEPWRASLGLSGGVMGGVAPSLAPVLALDVAYAPHNARLWMLSALFAESAASVTPAADAQFRLLAGRLAFCPGWLRRAPWAATSCIEGELGQLRAAASGVNHATTQRMPWFGLGLTARGELALSAGLAITAQALVRAQMVHDRFILEPSRTIYQVPVIAGEFVSGLSLAWH